MTHPLFIFLVQTRQFTQQHFSPLSFSFSCYCGIIYVRNTATPRSTVPSHAPTPAPSSSPTVPPITKYRWSSSGGGWRSMVGLMGFANVFAQAGLITPDSSAFSSVSTLSGASWISTQFFYSPQFFTNVTTSTPDELASFVLQWMNSYEAIFWGKISHAIPPATRHSKISPLIFTIWLSWKGCVMLLPR